MINNCRLFLGVTLYSDVTYAEGSTLDTDFLTGQPGPHSSRTCIKYPTQARPHATAWILWQSFWRKRSTRNRLHRRLGKWLYHHDQLTREWPFLATDRVGYFNSTPPTKVLLSITGRSLNPASPGDLPADATPTHATGTGDVWYFSSRHLLDSTPQSDHHWTADLLHSWTVHIPIDEFFQYSQILVACDGSHDPDRNQSSFGIIIASPQGVLLASGYGVAPSSTGSSYRAEAIALLVTHGLLARWKDWSPTVTIYTDGQSVLKKLATGPFRNLWE